MAKQTLSDKHWFSEDDEVGYSEEDVKEALKELIDWVRPRPEWAVTNTKELDDKVKEIFGERFNTTNRKKVN